MDRNISQLIKEENSLGAMVGWGAPAAQLNSSYFMSCTVCVALGYVMYVGNEMHPDADKRNNDLFWLGICYVSVVCKSRVETRLEY